MNNSPSSLQLAVDEAKREMDANHDRNNERFVAAMLSHQSGKAAATEAVMTALKNDPSVGTVISASTVGPDETDSAVEIARQKYIPGHGQGYRMPRSPGKSVGTIGHIDRRATSLFGAAASALAATLTPEAMVRADMVQQFTKDVKEEVERALKTSDKQGKKRQYRGFETADFGAIMSVTIDIPKGTLFFQSQAASATGLAIIRWLHALTCKRGLYDLQSLTNALPLGLEKRYKREEDDWMGVTPAANGRTWSYDAFDKHVAHLLTRLILAVPDSLVNKNDLTLEDRMKAQFAACEQVTSKLRKLGYRR